MYVGSATDPATILDGVLCTGTSSTPYPCFSGSVTVTGAIDYAKCAIQVPAVSGSAFNVNTGLTNFPCNTMVKNPDSTWALKYSKTPDAGYPNGIGLQASLGILAAINFLGMICMAFVPETLGRSLEDLSGEEKNEMHTLSAGPVVASSSPAAVAAEPVAIA